METYGNILKMLNLTQSAISYLKMDIEGSELDFFDDIAMSSENQELFDRVEQLGMEIHHGDIDKNLDFESSESKITYEKYWENFQFLQKKGFVLVHFNKNLKTKLPILINNRKIAGCNEVVFIRKSLIS